MFQNSEWIKKKVKELRRDMTFAERIFWNRIKNGQMGYKFRHQVPLFNKYIADFLCFERKLIVEIDGGQHAENMNDIERTKYLENQDFRVLRFWNCDVLENVEGCLEVVTNNLKC